jgi:hypothetical protein
VKLAAMVIVVVANSGCSAIHSKRPPAPPLRSFEDCSTEAGPAVGDTLLTIASGVTAVGGLGIAWSEKMKASMERVPSWDPHTKSDEHANALLAAGLVALPATVACSLSARYGYRNIRACKVARRDLMERRSQMPLAPLAPSE